MDNTIELSDEQLDLLAEQHQLELDYERMVNLGHHNERELL